MKFQSFLKRKYPYCIRLLPPVFENAADNLAGFISVNPWSQYMPQYIGRLNGLSVEGFSVISHTRRRDSAFADEIQNTVIIVIMTWAVILVVLITPPSEADLQTADYFVYRSKIF